DGLVDCDDDDCSFPLFSNYALGDSNSRIVSLGDLDGDGDLDAWVANSVNQANRVWINQGGVQGGVAGNFLDSGQALGNSYSYGVALGDLDGDGDLDAWVANYDSQPNRVWINDGLGNFTDSGQALGDSESIDVSLGDLDGDGDLDAWVVNENQPNRVWINQGGDQGGVTGDFADSGQALGDSRSLGVSLGDLDGDGDLDAWVVNDNQPNRVWINQGGDQGGVTGNFADSGQALGNSRSTSVALGDLDGDGDLDAWVANWQNRANRVWINDGLGNFADSGQGIGSSVSTDVSLGDLDGDGDLDAWVANWGWQANRVYMNLSSCSPDLDGDGIPNACDIDQTQGDDCDGNG
ncbi:MAG TPA: hypothetical protein EYN51_06170, partial [Flavobacteriales bacterium]|nr:hypothetical protein [Flavobacteriales bacterium]